MGVGHGWVEYGGRGHPKPANEASPDSRSDSIPGDEAGIWHKALLHEAVPRLIRKWERKPKVHVAGYFLQRMKTKWGSCNHKAGHIRLNTELVKKPKDLLEYVIVHEMVHLIEPTHSDRFIAILTRYYPSWREASAELNELPLAAETWRESSARRVGRSQTSDERS